jgi:hypothetical protein
VANLIYEGPHATNPLHVFAYDSAGGKSLFVADSGSKGGYESGDCRNQAIYQWDVETQTQLPTLDLDVALGINGTIAWIGCIDYLEYDAKRQLLISGSKGTQPSDDHNFNGTQWSSVNSSHVMLVWSTATTPPKLLAQLQGHNTTNTHTAAVDPATRVVTNEVMRAVTYDRTSGRLVASISEDIDHNEYAGTPWGYGSGSCLPTQSGSQRTCKNMGSYSCGQQNDNSHPCDEFNLTGSMQLDMLDMLQTNMDVVTPQGKLLGKYNGSHVRLSGWFNNDTEHPGNLSDAKRINVYCGDMVAAWTPENATISFPDLLAYGAGISPPPPPRASCWGVSEGPSGKSTPLSTAYNALWMSYDARLDVLNVSMQWPGQSNPSNRTRFTLWPRVPWDIGESSSHKKIIEQTEDSIMQWDLALDAKKKLPVPLPRLQLELGCDPSPDAATNSSCHRAASPAGGWASGLAYDSVGHRLYTLGRQDFVRRGGKENEDGSWPEAACNRTIEQWDTTSALLPPRHLHTMHGHTGCVEVLAFDAIHKRLYSGSNDSTSAQATFCVPFSLLACLFGTAKCIMPRVRVCVRSHRVGHESGTATPGCRARQFRWLARGRY